MLIDYIYENFEKGEPIFLSELPCLSKNYLRQEMKKLADEGKIVRQYNGVYYIAYETILGTEGKMSLNKFIEKKFLSNDKNGFYTGLSLLNKYGFTSQNPNVYEIVSNEATTKQRRINIDDNSIIIYKPVVKITEDNIVALEFLELMKDLDILSELSGAELSFKIKEYLKIRNVNFDIVKKYISLYPDRVYRNIYNVGVMNELV